MSHDRFDHVFIAAASFDLTMSFYRDVMCWTVKDQWGEAGSGRGVRLESEGASIVIVEPNPGGSPGRAGDPGRPALHLKVDDVDARYESLRQAALFPPEDNHWGTRWFVVRDPDGNRIAFESPRRG